MRFRFSSAFLCWVGVLGLAGNLYGQDAPAPSSKTESKPATADDPETKSKTDASKTDASNKPKKPTTELATFGGGCFWCTEAVFERIPGVKSVTSGYSGGNVPNPTYEMVCTGETGHAEVVQIEFDPEKVSFDKLLTVFWKAHDPTQLNMQGDDYGTQYRSIVLYHSDAQKKAVEKSAHELKVKKVFRRSIVTQLVPFQAFYPAEFKHQDYYRKNWGNDYTTFYIEPKLRKLRLK